MRGETIHRGVLLGLAFSVFMHAGAGFLASTVSMASGTNARLGGDRASAGELFALELPEPDAARDREAADRAEPPPPMITSPAVLLETAAKPPEPERPLVLGIDQSDQITENWIGFANPTEHLAPHSEVEQPHLDPEPGAPGAMAAQPAAGTPAPKPPSPTTEASSPVGNAGNQPDVANAQPRTAEKVPLSPKPAEDRAREGADRGRLNGTGSDPAREGEDGATGKRSAMPPPGTAAPPVPAADASGPRPEPQGVREGKSAADVGEPESPRRVQPAQASAPPATLPRDPGPPGAADQPNRSSHADRATPPSKSSAPGAAGNSEKRPGEKSAKESDASSLKDTLEIRPGHPAAAQGLEIITKRPVFTRLTEVTAYPDNPLLKITFNRLGVVTRVRVVESSGNPDVDEPVVNAVYQWTAKGKAISDLATKGAWGPGGMGEGLTVSVRIILR